MGYIRNVLGFFQRSYSIYSRMVQKSTLPCPFGVVSSVPISLFEAYLRSITLSFMGIWESDMITFKAAAVLAMIALGPRKAPRTSGLRNSEVLVSACMPWGFSKICRDGSCLSEPFQDRNRSVRRPNARVRDGIASMASRHGASSWAVMYGVINHHPLLPFKIPQVLSNRHFGGCRSRTFITSKLV